MHEASEDGRAWSESPGGGATDFTGDAAYRGALALCGLIYDLEVKIPDDERPDLYSGMKRAAIQVGALIASGFGRLSDQGGREAWERARSSLMETRHYVLLAQSRYFLDVLDVQAFDALYAEVLEGITRLLREGRR